MRALGILFCLFAFFCKESRTNAQVPASDSLALVNFYNNTNGPNWFNNTNWLTGPVYTWYGISVQGQGVAYIELPNNNLNGPLVESLSELTQLSGLQLNNNNLTGYIPDAYGNLNNIGGIVLWSNHLTGPFPLSLGNSPGLLEIIIDSNDFTGPIPDTILKRSNLFVFSTSDNQFSSLNYYPDFSYYLDIRGNKLTFKDIVPYCLNSTLLTFKYAPQDSILETIDTTILAGSNISFSSWVDTCSNNRYRWMKDYVFITPLDTNSILHLDSVQLNDSGNYTCYVVNSDAPLLTLYRKVIHLHLVDTTVGIPKAPVNLNIKLNYSLQDSKLTIVFKLNGQQYVNCYLLDSFGRKVIRLYDGYADHQELIYYLDELHLKPGLYFVKLETAKHLLCRKVIVQ